MSKVLKGAGVLALCAIVAKLIGAVYRIPLTNLVGAEGIGLYQMVFPLYTVLLTVSSGGLPVAISRVVSDRIAKGDEKGARKVLFVALVSLSIAGALLAVLLVLLRYQIAGLQGNRAAALPYLGIAHSLFFVAIIAAFRGYYQGKQNMLPSALSQLTEQIFKLGVGLALATILLPRGLEVAVFGAMVGVSISELITAGYLAIQFAFTNRNYKKRTLVALNGEGNTNDFFKPDSSALAKKSPQNALTEAAADVAVCSCGEEGVSAIPLPNSQTDTTVPMDKKETRRSILREIYKIAIPVTLGSLVIPLTQVVDSILVINLLVARGAAQDMATRSYGLLTGPVNTMINMPVVISLSFAVALLPKIAECFAKKECIDSHISQSLKYNLMIGLFSAVSLAIFARPIMNILYAGGLTPQEQQTGAVLLMLGTISIVYISILQVATSVLQGAGLAHKPAVNLLFGALFKIVLTLALLPFFGIIGAIVASVACYGVTAVLDIRSMLKVAKPNLNIKEILLIPIAATAAFGGVAVGALFGFRRIIPSLWASVAAVAIGSIIFFGILIGLKSIKKEELKSFPGIGKFIGYIEKKRKEKRQTKKM